METLYYIGEPGILHQRGYERVRLPGASLLNRGLEKSVS